MDKPYRRGFFGLGAQFNAYEGPSKTTYHGQEYAQRNAMLKYSNHSNQHRFRGANRREAEDTDRREPLAG